MSRPWTPAERRARFESAVAGARTRIRTAEGMLSGDPRTMREVPPATIHRWIAEVDENLRELQHLRRRLTNSLARRPASADVVPIKAAKREAAER